MRGRVAVTLLTLVALATVGGVASAQEVDRVRVGAPGRNVTRGFSPALFVMVTTPPDFHRRRVGHWEGPVCEFAPNPGLSGPISMTWGVRFSDSVRTAEAAARESLTFDWKTIESGSIGVPHLNGGRRVGTVPGFFVVTDAESQTDPTRARSGFCSEEASSQAPSSGREATRCNARYEASLLRRGTASRPGGRSAPSCSRGTSRLHA
jgi:hypothetical protein